MLIAINRINLQGKDEPYVVNTDDILSMDIEEDEVFVNTSTTHFPISMDTYKALLATKVIKTLGELAECE